MCPSRISKSTVCSLNVSNVIKYYMLSVWLSWYVFCLWITKTIIKSSGKYIFWFCMEIIRKGPQWYFTKGKKIRINNEGWYKPLWFKATGKQSCFNNWIYFPFAFIVNCFARKGLPTPNGNYYGKLICSEI